MQSLTLIYGAGGHGRVLLDTLRALDQEPDGFIDDDGPQQVDGLPVYQASILEQRSVSAVYHGIGYIEVRRRIAGRLAELGIPSPVVVHPTAWISPNATLGAGTVVYAGAVVNTGAIVGEGVILNTHCVVEHDVRIGPWCHVSPNATLGGAAILESGVWVAMGSTVLPMVKIGRETILGANAVAVRDLPERIVAVGAPARRIKHR